MTNPIHCYQLWAIRDAKTDHILNTNLEDIDDSIDYHPDNVDEDFDDDGEIFNEDIEEFLANAMKEHLALTNQPNGDDDVNGSEEETIEIYQESSYDNSEE